MPVCTHRSRHLAIRSRSGFTLIEILVVMVIVGIIMAVAMLSFGLLGDDRNLEREARRLSSLIQMANDDATIQGRDFGLELMLSGYRFVEHDPFLNQWFEVTGDDFMRERQLEEGMQFELTIEEHRVLLHEEAQETESNDENARDLTDDYLPHILILSSGDSTPFALRIIRDTDKAEVSLTMSLTGQLEIGNDSTESM